MTTENKKKTIGAVINKGRLKKDLTQQQVSDITGLSRNYISDIENGRYTPSIDAISKLAKCLDIDLNFLLPLTDIQVK